MAKKSKIAKFNKQQDLMAKYAQRRQELKAAGDVEGLSKLPLDSHPNRLRTVIYSTVAHMLTCGNLG